MTSTYVRTYGNASTGIDAFTTTGNVTVNSNTVITSGLSSPGIDAHTPNGNVSVTSNFVHTYGDTSNGIEAYTAAGAVTSFGEWSPRAPAASAYWPARTEPATSR